MLSVLRVLEFLAGLAVVVAVLDATIRTFVLPRPARVRLARATARALRAVFNTIAKFTKTYAASDRIWALYGPVTLLSYSVGSLIGVGAGYVLMFHATGVEWRESLRDSGSALFTLGFAMPHGYRLALVFSEAAIGLILVALLIAYLPTIYGTFSRREIIVSELSVRGGTPPTPAELIGRAHRVGYLDDLNTTFQTWRLWFLELGETHTSLAVLPYFRSPNPDRNWLTAAGAILDTAAFMASTVDVPFSVEPPVLLRTGSLSLRAIAEYYRVPFDPDPRPGDPIAVTQEEFAAVYDELAATGVPLRGSMEDCWPHFAGWRVNYDTVLLELARIINAPVAPWVSDRSPVRGSS
jgi:hypothetical protein